jgi:YhcH/YjgK/YiaL family protein
MVTRSENNPSEELDMILDRIENAARYSSLNPGFAAAFKFLRQAGIENLKLGRHEIYGDRVYALVAKDKGRNKDEAKLEAHRKYIDIQFILSGTDEMGWKDLKSCGKASVAYVPEKDIEFFACKPDSWIAVGPRAFALFFPEDAHAPMIGGDMIHKVIVKVAC